LTTEVRVARVGAEGDGVATLEDGTQWFLRGVLPGEYLRARAVGKRGDGFAADVEELLSASPERVAPPCRHAAECGGCTLQHWRAEPYLTWKVDLLEAALRRAGYVPTLVPIVPSAPRTRRRMDFAVRRERGALRLGLHAPRSHAIVDIADCHLLHPSLTALLPALRAILAALAAVRREADVVCNLLDTGPDLLLRSDAEPTAPDRTRLADFARAHGIRRIAWARGAGVPETVVLNEAPRQTFAGIAVTPPPGAFMQATAEGEAAIVAAVLAGLPSRLPARARVADLYAGCGTLSFPLAAKLRVAAYEGDAAACAALRAAANGAALGGRIEAAQRDLVRQPLTARELAGFAAVVLDPPFAGAPVQISQLAASTVARVIYVSCNPAALARDAATLRASGYSLLSATPVDQFLWSARLESVCVFAR
jgi:23S rRNA (uracil1939-C5)-methyltransferase